MDTAFPELMEQAAALHSFSHCTTRGQSTTLHFLHASQSTLCAVAYLGSSSLYLPLLKKKIVLYSELDLKALDGWWNSSDTA